MKKMTLSSLAMTVLCMALNAQITIQLPANFTPHKVPDEIKGVNISANSNFGWINNTSFIDEIQNAKGIYSRKVIFDTLKKVKSMTE